MTYSLDHPAHPATLHARPAPSWPQLPFWLVLRPRRAMQALALAPGWITALPVGLALILAYARFLAAALLLPADPAPALLVALAQIGLGWLGRALALTVLIALLGGRSTFGRVYRLAVWAGLPLLLRQALQTLYLLYTGVQPDSPGLALFADSGPVHHLLGYADLYNLWFVILLAAAVNASASLPRSRIRFVVALYSVGAILLGLAATQIHLF